MDDDQLTQAERSHVRIKVFLSAELTWKGQSSSIRVRNISRWGLAADALDPPSLGAIVHFKRGKVERSARVMWLKDGRFGLRFDRPMNAEDELQIHFPSGSEGRVRASAPLFNWQPRR
jgi:hypothetical protein